MVFIYKQMNDEERRKMNEQVVGFNYSGHVFRLAHYWWQTLPTDQFSSKPINYLEIGVHNGCNLFSVANSYGLHPESKLWGIDPWMDYDDYPEYKDEQTNNFNVFLSNLEKSPHKNKVSYKRGFSNTEIPKFDDEFFDMIYIDGNHEPEFVLEDAVLSFRKLKTGGIMIFDDYTWGGPDMTKRGIDGFLHGYHKRIEVIGCFYDQVFLRKTKSYNE